jgi:hypothetical protein
MKKKLFILISILAISCHNDETTAPTDKNALNLVTGVNFRQNPEDQQLQLGNPNALVNGKFIIYPNPAIESAFITAQGNVTDVWFVPANPEKIYQDVNFSSILNTNLYSEQSIISHSNFSVNGQSSNNISLNIGTLEKGYYRVFVKIGGEIYWDNFLKIDGEESNEEHFNTIVDFWN